MLAVEDILLRVAMYTDPVIFAEDHQFLKRFLAGKPDLREGSTMTDCIIDEIAKRYT
jgi:hypothetical protein